MSAVTAPHSAETRVTAPRRTVRSWQLYDWANSAFVTTVVAALAGPYVTAVANRAADDDGILLRIGALHLPADAYFPYVVSASVLVQVLVLPLLGAVADRTGSSRRLLGLCCSVGAAATTGLLWASGTRWVLAGVLFGVANVAFGASIVVYNAMLPRLAAPADQHRVSAGGFALGYLGGGLLLALDLLLVVGHSAVGLTTASAARWALASAGIWWGVFGWLAVRGLRGLPEPVQVDRVTGIGQAVGELRQAVRELRALPQTARFLVAFLLYNDAVQAVIGLASVFLTQELFVAKGKSADDATSFLLGLILLIQLVAAPGAVLVERLARRVGAKRAVEGTLVVWIAVVLFAWAVLDTQLQALIMGVVIAVVLGGSQALSRSLFASMLPSGREASFFGFYELSERGTAWIATATFATVLAVTGSYRQAILSLVVLFAVGLVLLVRTDTDRAAADAQAAQALSTAQDNSSAK